MFAWRREARNRPLRWNRTWLEAHRLAVSFQKVVHSGPAEETGVTTLQSRKDRMDIHKNARLTLRRREEMALMVIEGSLSQAQAALKFAVTAKVVKQWVERYKAEDRAGMIDRSSRPKRSPHRPLQRLPRRSRRCAAGG